MKKSLFMLLMLAVAGMAASCEREFVNANNETGGQTNSTIVEENDAEEAKKFVGCWTRTVEANPNSQMDSHSDYMYYFEENGSGYRTMDGYNKEEVINHISRASLSYWVKGGNLWIQYSDSEPDEWEYKFSDNTLSLHRCGSEPDNIKVYTKVEEADSRFIGDWSTTTKYGEYYYDEHIKFVTPMDGFMYHSVYDNPNAAPIEGPSYPQWFKYTFDDDVVYITSVEGMNATPTKKYYRFAGGKLYLSNSKGGNETCYSTIKKE
ncbi:MAG: hypothetical protein J6U59_07020 [Alistipes sp.]|nr:hypothetical protein [Alistipes sp.]